MPATSFYVVKDDIGGFTLLIRADAIVHCNDTGPAGAAVVFMSLDEANQLGNTLCSAAEDA